MKKILVFSIVFILLIGIVSSSALSTLWKQGVSAANPQAAKVIGMADQIMEIKTIAQCATGVGASACMQTIMEQKAMGQVYGKAIKAAGPEVQKVISTYQQLDLYREAGAELIDLKIDEEGEIKGGTIQFSGEEESDIGNLIGKNIKKGDISVKNSKVEIFNEKERENNLGVARITFDKKGASAKIDVNDFSGVMSQEETGKPAYVELDKDGNIVKADFMTGEKGGVFNFGGVKFNTPPNSNVFYDADNGELKLEKGSEIKEILDEITISGENIKFPNEVTMTGTLSYDENGQAFIKSEDIFAEINGVKVYNLKSSKSKPINIFFDGKHHDERYVSFGEQNLIMKDLGSEGELGFLKNNPYLKIEDGDYVSMTPMHGSEIEITNRDAKGLIPKVITKGPFNIHEDSKNIKFMEDVRIYSDSQNIFTTSPIELNILDSDGTTKFGIFKDGKKMMGHKVFIDNFNRIAIVPDTTEDILVSSDKIDVKFSARIKYNYPTMENINRLVNKKISSYVSEGKESMMLGRLRDYYNTITPATKNSIQSITLGNQNYFKNEGVPLANAFAKYDGTINFKDSEFNLKVFKHEGAHTRHFQILKEWEKEQSSFSKIFRRDSPFDRKWMGITKSKEYGKMVSKGKLGYWMYNNGKNADSPSEGFVKAYGATTQLEDIATFVENANKPEFFSDLINPQSSEYDIKYRQKLDLLYQYKFIPNNEYNKILETAGVN